MRKAEKERDASSSLEEIQSVHFLLHYDGSEAKGLGQKILDALEIDFRDLQLDLDYYPRETIVVLVYSKDTFRDITRTPDWVGAMNEPLQSRLAQESGRPVLMWSIPNPDTFPPWMPGNAASPGGVQTPSVAMAAPLLARLRAAGLTFAPAQ